MEKIFKDRSEKMRGQGGLSKFLIQTNIREAEAEGGYTNENMIHSLVPFEIQGPLMYKMKTP